MGSACARPLALAVELCEDDDEHRRHDCPGYQACLEYCAQLDWESWSCAMCDVRGAPKSMRVSALDADGTDWWRSKCVVYDPVEKKVVAGRHLVCQARDEGRDILQAWLVRGAACPLCYATLWGDEVLQGRDGCSGGHICFVDGDGEIVVERSKGGGIR